MRVKLLFTFALSLLAFLHAYSQDPVSVWIDEDFDETTQGWDITHFADIQKGIDHVAIAGSIYVAQGTYFESLIINKSIVLFGEIADSTIVDAKDSTHAVFINNVQNVQIIGFTFMNATESGIYLLTTDSVTIEGNILKQNHNAGVQLLQSAECIIDNNQFIQNNMSMELSRNNEIINNEIMSEWPISLTTSSYNLIENNDIHSLHPSGITLMDVSVNNQILNNRIISDRDNYP